MKDTHAGDMDTMLAQIGRDPAAHQGMVNVPVYRTSTVIFPNREIYEKRLSLGDKAIRYGRLGTPTTYAFEDAVARLEGGFRAAAAPNGLAAMVAVLLALSGPGKHLLVSDAVYGPVRKFCQRRLIPAGVDVEFYDPLIGGGIEALFREQTCAVYCESPASLSFEVQDLPAIGRAARARDIPVVADNTWATPYFFAPFEHGVDISVHAATKYIGGHSDVMLGVVVANERWWPAVRDVIDEYGYSVSPDDCFLALRGLRTLGVRLRQQMQNALEVAAWLEERPEVQTVIYPALPSHPQHHIWKRDFRGAASLFSWTMRERIDEATLSAFIDSLRLFGIGSSWGGYESLVQVAHIASQRSLGQACTGGPTIRLHIGLESPDALKTDLGQAFRVLSADRREA